MNRGIFIIRGALRIFLGWIFLWAFMDKLFGLGFSTIKASAWINGGSPTLGFLKYATKGPLGTLFQSLAGSGAVDWIFMMGLLGIGLCLMLGVAVRFSSWLAIIMLALMYLAALWPVNNPIIDEHVIYITVLIYLSITEPGEFMGLGKWWKSTALARRFPIFNNS
jgi:thiosulfate dehydrogenase [quinone] large subunit